MVLKPERQCFEMIRNFATKRAAFGESKFANVSQRIRSFLTKNCLQVVTILLATRMLFTQVR